MNIAIIAAISRNGVIGNNNQLPWHLPADLAHFKALTIGKPIIMGRNTFTAIGKPLAKRHNIVISRDPHYQASGVTVAHSIAQAIAAAGQAEEVMVIGGATLYQQALAMARRMYLTMIDKTYAGDTFFPQWEQQQWLEVSREQQACDQNNPVGLTFLTLERRQ